MVRILSITALALAAVSAVSGLVVPRLNSHAIRNSHLEVYPKYHRRSSKTGCKARPHGYSSGGNETSSSSSSSYSTPLAPTPTPAYVASTPEESPQPDQASESPSSTSSTPSPSPTPASDASGDSSSSSGNNNSSDNNSGVNTGGVATFFYQNGNKGACGQVHSDNDFICAMDQARYGTSGNASPLCGNTVVITNTDNGKSVTVTVADDCPTCNNANSIDLSVAAFNTIADPSQGEVPISWTISSN